MSNPGVITLASDSKYKLKIEDNIGEAIHLHYENIRLDLTVEEFEKLSACMNDVIDELVDVDGFSSYNINPENLVQISSFLHKLIKAEKDEVYLNNLFVNTNNGKYVSLKKVKTAQKVSSQKEQIILFGNKNYVICGQEQCLNLYKEQGNIKIPVTRLFFDKSVTIRDLQKNQQKASLIMKTEKFVRWIIRHIKSKFN